MNHRIIVVSDTHCHLALLRRIVEHETAREPGVAAVLHCGDIGLYDEGSPGRLARRELELLRKHQNPLHESLAFCAGELPLPHLVHGVPGNHEDFALVQTVWRGEHRIDGLHLLRPGEDTRLSVGDRRIRILGLGRILPDETTAKNRGRIKYIQPEDLQRTLRAGLAEPLDILLVHDPPSLRSGNRAFGSGAVLDLVEAIRPRLVLAGHMHFEYDTRIQRSRVVGVGYGARGRYLTVNRDLDLTFRDLDGRAAAPRPASLDTGARAHRPPPDHRERRRQVPSRTIQLPLGAKQIRDHFGLGRLNKRQRRRMERLFVDMRRQVVDTGRLTRRDALEMARAFLQENGLIT